tara:strand:- start:112 stop:249 length:138 start_codon:yes stop_codon:yes gene_type:complete
MSSNGKNEKAKIHLLKNKEIEIKNNNKKFILLSKFFIKVVCPYKL